MDTTIQGASEELAQVILEEPIEPKTIKSLEITEGKDRGTMMLLAKFEDGTDAKTEFSMRPHKNHWKQTKKIIRFLGGLDNVGELLNVELKKEQKELTVFW